jgi:hypothetical protein
MKNFSFLLLMLLMSAFACIGYNSYIMSKTQNITTIGNTGVTGNTGDTGTPDNTTPGNPANAGTPSNPVNPGANSQTIQMYVTSYGFNDNDNGAGQYSTGVIAYPKKEGNPTHHDVATEGTGTYADPITFAAGIKAINGGTFPVGSILYVPFLQKYFMLEDQCAECDKDLNGQKYHIDLYMGPADHPSSQGPLYDCEGKITRNTAVILKPASNLPVDTNPLFQNNQCTAHPH